MFLLSLHLNYARIVVEKEGGGPTGYDKVTEVHDEDYHYLGCEDEGWESCTWSVLPEAHPGFPELIDYAEGQIAEGNLEGTYSAEYDGVTCYVQWKATDIYNLRIELWTENESPPQE